MTWLDQPHAAFVVAAYGAAAVAWGGIVLASVLRWRRTRAAWRRMKDGEL